MTEFILFAFLAGIGVAAVAGPLGCFVVWRRMAYFGDTSGTQRTIGSGSWYSFEHRDWYYCCASVPIDCPVIGGASNSADFWL